MYPAETADELDLRDYLVVLRRRKWSIVAITSVVVLVALGMSLRETPIYKASSEILLRARSTDTLFNPQTGAYGDPNRRLQTEIAVIEGDKVASLVRERLGETPAFSASPRANADIVVVSATSPDPVAAAKAANAYADAYVQVRKNEQVEDLGTTIKELTSKIGELQGQIEALDASAAAGGRTTTTDAAKTAQRGALVAQQAAFKTQLDQLAVSQAIQTGGASVQSPAVVPRSPVSPQPKRTGALALVVGLMLGVGVAFLREFLDDTIKDKEGIERHLGGLTVMGMIPAIKDWKDHKRPMVVAETDPKSPAAEAYRSVRTSIQFLGLDRTMHVLQVTSPTSSEGKTTTLANLAVTLAQAGQRVIVVDCDLRRPRIHDFFGLPNEVGFTSVLLGDTPLSGALQKVPGVERLLLMASGPLPPNPSELLSSRRTGEVIDGLKAVADVVLLDSPPMLPVTDAAVLSHRVDGMLLVAAAGKTTGKALERTRELLAQVEAPMIGAILNGVKGEGGYAYHYAYTYAYAQDQPKGRAAKKAAAAAAAASNGAGPAHARR